MIAGPCSCRYGLAIVTPVSPDGERQLRTIIDTIPALAWSATPDGYASFFNSRWLEYTGLSAEEAGGWGWSASIHPNDRDALMLYWNAVLRAGEPGEVEVRMRRFDGVYRWFLIRASPLRDDSGRIERWYGTNTDIDDRKNVEDALRTVQARLSRATELAAVSELSASIAHEINQPLAAVVAYGDACRRWLTADPPNVERALLAAERIVRDARSAAEFIRATRALFRRRPPALSPVAINELIVEVGELLREHVRTHGVSLQMQLQDDLPIIRADAVQIQQVISNLARNGIEAMHGIGDRARVLVLRSKREAAEIGVEIADTGVGVPDTRKIFEGFFTTKPDGMGMGLVICRSIVAAHGGRLSAARNEPHGSVFRFSLPTAS